MAPLALAVMVLATIIVVEHALSSSSGQSNVTSTTHTSSGASPTVTKKSSTGATKSKFYVVRSGDSLSVISARTGVSLPTLESLNPGVSSSSLQVGQRLRLRR